MIADAPVLAEDRAAVVDALRAFMSDHDEPLSDDRPAEIAMVRRRLGTLGLWTVGVPEEAGGGGAGFAMTCAVLTQLAHRWAALAWAAAQADVASHVWSGDDRWTAVGAELHDGSLEVAVVSLRSPAVHLELEGGRITGSIDRLDASGPRPWVVVLGDAEAAYVLDPRRLDFTPVRRTGLAGACTVSATLAEPVPANDGRIDGVDCGAATVRLLLAAAAIAAGIADAATTTALAYCAGRHQFGGPLTALATVRESLFVAARAAAMLLHEVPQPASTSAWQASARLDTACELAIDAAFVAVQLHGGYGYLAEYPVERLLRDAVSLRAASDVTTHRRTGAAALAASAGVTGPGARR